MSSKTRVLALLDDNDIKHMDKLVEDGTYSSRSHYIRQAVKYFR